MAGCASDVHYSLLEDINPLTSGSVVKHCCGDRRNQIALFPKQKKSRRAVA